MSNEKLKANISTRYSQIEECIDGICEHITELKSYGVNEHFIKALRRNIKMVSRNLAIVVKQMGLD